MHVGKTLFAQLMDFLPWTSFHRIVQRYGGNTRVRSLSCAEQFRALAFAQLTYRAPFRSTKAANGSPFSPITKLPRRAGWLGAEPVTPSPSALHCTDHLRSEGA
jgi:hypothetical protein